MRRLPSLFFLLSLIALAGFATAQDAESVPTGRLPDWAKPKNYRLDLRVDPRQEQFSGQLAITVELRKRSDHLWLHGKDLQVQRAELITAQGQHLPAGYSQADGETGVARIDFGKRLEPQTLTLNIQYQAPLNKQLQGLYRINYQGRAYAITQMEPISARYAFPGFDEPSLRATYDLSLTVPSQDRALANTREISSEPAGQGWKKVRFATTRPLPSYLLAFAVGPWDVLDGPPISPRADRSAPVPLRGVAAKGQARRLDIALGQTPQIIHFFEDYFGIGYPFNKLDLAAVPDFAAGAMENPGLVTFRDWLLLLDKNSPQRNLEGSFNVTAHELAHQWTGDLVTMAWWDDLWLNEAFATWAQQKLTMALRPQYHADLDRFDGALGAMAVDSLVSARQIRQPIKDNGDISSAFDSITYDKGAAVLGMFEAFVGEDKFRQGMHNYLEAHRFGNATAFDLIDAIAEASGQGDDFKKAFTSFIEQPGVPYLRASLHSAGGDARLHVTQERYLPLGSQGDKERLWGLPLCIKYGTAQGLRRVCRLLDKAEADIPLPGAGPDSWVLPNAGGAGYYRFALDGPLQKRLTEHLGELQPIEQLAYSDALDAAFAHGDVGSDALLAGLRQLARSPHEEVVSALLPRFTWLWRYLAESPAQRARLLHFAEENLLPRLQALGYRRRPGETISDTRLRPQLAYLLGIQLRLPAVRQSLLQQAQAVLPPDGQLHFAAVSPDLLGTVLAVAAQERGAPVVGRLKQSLHDNGDPVQRNALLQALAEVREPAQVEGIRELALGDDVKLNEMFALLNGGDADRQSYQSFWPWFTQNYARIHQRTGPFRAARLPRIAAAGACSIDAAQQLQDFFGPRLKELVGGQRGLAQASESLRLCAALRQAQQAGFNP